MTKANSDKVHKWLCSLGLKNKEEWKKLLKAEKLPTDIPRRPDHVYKDQGWTNWPDFLNIDYVVLRYREHLPFEEARKLVDSLKIKSENQWNEFRKSDKKPEDIPVNPRGDYKKE